MPIIMEKVRGNQAPVIETLPSDRWSLFLRDPAEVGFNTERVLVVPTRGGGAIVATESVTSGFPETTTFSMEAILDVAGRIVGPIRRYCETAKSTGPFEAPVELFGIGHTLIVSARPED